MSAKLSFLDWPVSGQKLGKQTFKPRQSLIAAFANIAAVRLNQLTPKKVPSVHMLNSKRLMAETGPGADCPL